MRQEFLFFFGEMMPFESEPVDAGNDDEAIPRNRAHGQLESTNV